MDGHRFAELFRKKPYILALIFCALGVGLNLALGELVSKLNLPLYLDTVGTVAIAVMGGYLPGVIVGFTTNIVKSISDPTSLYYGALNVLIALFATHLSRQGWFKKLPGIFGLIVIFTLIGGGLGALFPWFMEDLSFDSESLSLMFNEAGVTNQFLSHLLSNLIMDLPDKAITVILALVIQRIIPTRYHHLFELRGWLQTPVSDERALLTERKSVRFLSLRTKIIFVLSISLISVAAVVIGISMTVYHKTVIREHTRIAKGTAEIAASVIDGNHVTQYLKNGYDATGYRETEELLKDVLYSSTDIAYLYAYQIRADGCHVVFDIDTKGENAAKVGSIVPLDEGFAPYRADLLDGKRVEPVFTSDRYGELLTAYQPVYDLYGKCVCYVGADVDMSQLTAMERSYLVEMVSVFMGFFILLGVFVIWLVRYHIVFPVNTITECVDEFSREEDTQEALDRDVKTLRKLNVHTGDEIETLYRSVCQMTLRQTEQVRNVRRLSESTAKMQDGLIITMADMVENRDSDTGAHIQKTAAYVKIIVEGLKKKGYYAEKITPKFMSDVVRSAPLHDVGKINIPDGILNKPGKLSDEEYEIMKTHTTHGKKIMEHAISTVEGENYLKEARNMAAYHHERWDGKGYPEGLHGEVIPLSARIMSVADVFDALTSPRVYKPAFPLEKALSIIEEGSGTQFDPKCVEVFMESLGEVKVILHKYNREA